MMHTDNDSERFTGFTTLMGNMTCDLHGCQVTYESYIAMYKKHLEQTQHIKQLQDERDRLLLDQTHKIRCMELHNEQLKEEFIRKQTLVLDALQDGIDTIPPGADKNANDTCDKCVCHKTALNSLRQINQQNFYNVTKRAVEVQRILDSFQEEMKKKDIENGRLRVLLGRANNPSQIWRDLDIECLKSEADAWKRKCTNSEEVAATLKNLNEAMGKQLAKMWRNNDALELELEEMKADAIRLKRTRDEIDEEPQGSETKKQKTAVLDEKLRMKLNCIFNFEASGAQIATEKWEKETALYDAFVLSIPANEKEEWFELVHASCFAGEKLPARNKKKIREHGNRSKVCKQSFSSCLLAMGGVAVKNGTNILWKNVKIRREMD
jgi:hypothetical protein